MSKTFDKSIAILHSKREGIFYLEHCRVMMRDDRVDYAVDQESAGTYYWNIPTGNTSVLLLGTGTSITQAAARRLSEDGVMLAFAGGGGTPIFLASQSEYRPTEYLQGWVGKWFVPEKRLEMARRMAVARCNFVDAAWGRIKRVAEAGASPQPMTTRFRSGIVAAASAQAIMEAEAQCAKQMYAILAKAFGLSGFAREQGKRDGGDLANSFLDHGNYLAYGLAATVLWVLGIPHSLPVSHGLTRRGALVFDTADLVKDGIIMPLAFACAAEGLTDQEFRSECLREIRRLNAVEFMFETIKAVAVEVR
jgi:CRISPR-associated protein Cas1